MSLNRGWIVILLLVGCAHERAAEPRPEPTKTVTVVREPLGEAIIPPLAWGQDGGGTTSPAVATTPAEDPAEGALDDAKIIKVAHVANEGATEQAKLAEHRALDPRLRAIASKIVKDNQDADRRADRAAHVGKVKPKESSISSAMEQDWREEIDQLAEKDAGEFDRAFLEGQLEHQRMMLRLIDQELLPVATRPAVRNLVRSLRPAVVRRFDELRLLEQRMGR